MNQKTLNLKELNLWCVELVSSFKKKQIILLEGELGAGKTHFVSQCMSALGYKEASSPTFSLINEYSFKNKKVYHIDLYRLDGVDDLESIGFWDIFLEPATVFIEWPSRMEVSELPLDWSILKVIIKKNDEDNVRSYKIEN